MSKRKSEQTAKSEPDYEKLGRMLVDVYEFNFINKKRLLYMNLFRGIALGLGSVIGATVIVSLILFFLQVLGFGPLEPFQNWLKVTVQQPGD